MISADNLYEQNVSQRFHFEAFKKQCTVHQIDGIQRKNSLLLCAQPRQKILTILTSKGLEKLEIKALQVTDDEILAKHALYLAQSQGAASESSCNEHLLILAKPILQAQIQWLKQFFNWINNYLSKRTSAGKHLTQHDVMRINLAEALEEIRMTQIALSTSETIPTLRSTSQILLQAIRHLASCAGGRSFAGGNVLEFFWVSQLVNSFLLGDEKPNRDPALGGFSHVH